MYDVLIKGGTILDGSGRQRYRADIAVKNGIIVAIAPKISVSAKRVIDADGLFVTPGFIDTHAHSDDVVFIKNDCYNCLEQGITMQVAGNCGESPAPYPENALMKPIKQEVSEQELERIIRISKNSASFMAEAVKAELGVNMAFFVGHNALRAHAMGYVAGPPTKRQMDDMKENICKAMDVGFLGYSSGLVYAPSVYADTAELTELAKVVARYKGIYSSHIRGEGVNLFNSIREAIQIGRDSGASVLISHLKVVAPQFRGKANEVLALIHDARAEGINVFADQYPYTAGSAPLISQIPPKYLEGGREETLQQLKDADFRAKVEYSIFNEPEEFESTIYASGYDGAVIASADATPQYVGRTLAEIAKERGCSPIDAMADILLENDGTVQGIYHFHNLEDVLSIMADPYVYAGCDWFSYPCHYDVDKCGGGHPRGTSTMIHRLSLMRDNGIKTAEECIRSMTGGPATSLGLKGRGLLREGFAADICVLDYPNARATSDYLHPFRKNQGLHYVLVNGQLAVENGECLGNFAGQVVRRST